VATTRPSTGGIPAATLRAIHERFVTGDVDATYLESTPLRPEVADSWRRSLAEGVDPDCITEQAVSDDVSRLRQAHPLASAMPIVRQLLVEDAAESGVVVAVTAADGTLLWVEGDPNARRRAEAMNFVAPTPLAQRWLWIGQSRSVDQSISPASCSRGVALPCRSMPVTAECSSVRWT
jgi:hypothetical protein